REPRVDPRPLRDGLAARVRSGPVPARVGRARLRMAHRHLWSALRVRPRRLLEDHPAPGSLREPARARLPRWPVGRARKLRLTRPRTRGAQAGVSGTYGPAVSPAAGPSR